MDELPLIELIPIMDTWADDMVERIEIIGGGLCFRTTFFALSKIDGQWARVVVFKLVRAIGAYKIGRLGSLLAAAEKPPLVLH